MVICPCLIDVRRKWKWLQQLEDRTITVFVIGSPNIYLKSEIWFLKCVTNFRFNYYYPRICCEVVTAGLSAHSSFNIQFASKMAFI